MPGIDLRGSRVRSAGVLATGLLAIALLLHGCTDSNGNDLVTVRNETGFRLKYQYTAISVGQSFHEWGTALPYSSNDVYMTDGITVDFNSTPIQFHIHGSEVNIDSAGLGLPHL